MASIPANSAADAPLERAARWPTLARSPIPEATRRRWRAAGYWTDETIGDLLERSAKTWPSRIAVRTAETDVTFAELQSRSSAVARTLVASGVRHGDVVCWMLPTGADAIAVASAIWRIGAVSSPIVPLSRTREMAAAIDQVHPRAIITVADFRGRSLPGEFDEALEEAGSGPVARLTVGVGAIGWTRADAEGPGALPDSVQPSAPMDPCLILFTSGTESASKAVLHSPAALHHELRSTIGEWGLSFRDAMFMASPMTHITGLLQGFLIPARVGASAVLMDQWNGEQAVELIERTGATYMAGAAPFLRELLSAYRASGRESSSLRQYCCGGAAVPPDLISGIADFGVAAYRAWGMTELPTSTLSNELDSLELRSMTDGRLAAGIELRVLDDSGESLPNGVAGELQLRGPEMMLGYVRAEHNERAFTPDGWLRTGDIGSVGDDGFVRVTGRIKEIINRGGEKFSSREIENAVLLHPDVAEVAIVAVPGGRLGERIGAAIVSSRPDISVEEIGLIVTAAGLSKNKQPELLLVLESLPTNPTGKTDKNRIIAQFERSEAESRTTLT